MDNKLQQLEVKLERKLTESAYRTDSKLHQMDKNFTSQLNTIRKDHFHYDKRFRQLVDSVKEIVTIAGQQIGKLTDNFTLHNQYLEKAETHFQASKENHRDIALYYRQMIGPMDQLIVDLAYVVHTLKAHYPIPMSEDQAKSWDPSYEVTTSYVPVEAS